MVIGVQTESRPRVRPARTRPAMCSAPTRVQNVHRARSVTKAMEDGNALKIVCVLILAVFLC